MGVIELGENAALMLKAAEEEIVDVVVAEDLDGDAFFEAAVGSGGFKNDAQAASAELLLETIGAELRSGGDGRAEDGDGGGVIDQAGAGRVGREHAAKLVGEYGVGLGEIGQEGGALLGRFRQKGLELRAELAKFFSRHTQPVVMIARARAHDRRSKTGGLFLSGPPRK